MSDFPLPLNEIEDQSMVEAIVQMFLENSMDGNVVKKDVIIKFFDSLQENLENKSASPKTKFYSVFILKQLSVKEKISAKIFGPFAQHSLYLYLEDMAFNVDPKKNLSEKGKNLFTSDKSAGNELMRLILQSFVAWGGRFPTNSKKQPTKFKKTYNRLVEQKIVLPKEFVYYTVNTKKMGQMKETSPHSSLKGDVKSSKEVPSQKAVASTVAAKPKQSKQKYMIELKYMQNKIQQLLGIFQDGQQQQIRKQVASFHVKFQKDRQKLHEYEGFIFQLQNQQIVNIFLNVNTFLQEQEVIYNKFVLKDDFGSYLAAYQMNFEKGFQQGQGNAKTKTTPQPQPNKNQISIDKTINDKPKPAPPQHPKPANQKVASNQNINIESKSSINKKQNPGQTNNDRRMAQANANKDKQNRNTTQSFFARLNRTSKVAHEGFHSIAKSLQKSKLNTVVPRLKSSNANSSYVPKSKLTLVNKSRYNLKGIFANPPNPNVQAKNYEGQLVAQNAQLERQCQNVSKKQGLRRFKASLFKNKYILYEDQFIQVGFKSCPIYEKIEKFTSLLDFQIFFGNKTTHYISKFQIFFEGDKKSLIYTNPQKIEHIIFPQQQIKIQLLNVPKATPFNFIIMDVQYEILGDQCSFTALLPTSILQMTTYYDLDASQIDAKWRQCSQILKIQHFRLSHHFPPDQLVHFLPKLKQSIPYSIFSEQGNTADYELFCQIVIQQAFEAILKIIILPNLNVVLQIGAYDSNENHLRHFKFYLQSLMAALKQF